MSSEKLMTPAEIERATVERCAAMAAAYDSAPWKHDAAAVHVCDMVATSISTTIRSLPPMFGDVPAPKHVAVVQRLAGKATSISWSYLDIDHLENGTKLYAAPTAGQAAAKDAHEADPSAEWFSCLIEDIGAISCRHHGDPSYDHDAYYMRKRVIDMLEKRRDAARAAAPEVK